MLSDPSLLMEVVDQTTANQERELRDIAVRMGCEIVKVYKDQGISGAKGRDTRPAFDALCRDATKRQFDLVMAWSVDRLGRASTTRGYRNTAGLEGVCRRCLPPRRLPRRQGDFARDTPGPIRAKCCSEFANALGMVPFAKPSRSFTATRPGDANTTRGRRLAMNSQTARPHTKEST
jgi:hypothetical protein